MITNSIISYGDQLGAQMSTLSELIYLANENHTDLVFYNELRSFRRAYLWLKCFNTSKQLSGGGIVKYIRRLYLPIPELYCIQFKRKPKSVANYKRIYKDKVHNKLDLYFREFICKVFYADFKKMYYKNDVHCNPELLKLDSSKKYDIRSGFGTYQDWKKYENEVKQFYTFNDSITEKAESLYRQIDTKKQTVSVHFRKGDYLILSSLNLTLDYYKKALSYFDKDKYALVIFSDDIESCKNCGIFEGYDVVYQESHPAAVDMKLMSLCDNNIVANSSFSFWGAFLNQNEDKKVICPHDFIGPSSPDNLYINGNWYPENWIAL